MAQIAVLSSAQEGRGDVTLAPSAEKVPAVKEAPLLPGRARGVKEAHAKIDRRAKLREIMEHNAANHRTRLRDLLKTVPPSARPALMWAIAVSERGYEKALKSLEKPEGMFVIKGHGAPLTN